MKLSQRRADNVVNYLASHGIARSRLKAVGFGETRPIADNKTEVGRGLNRRVDAIIACATDIEGLTPRAARVALDMQFDTNRAEVKPQYREDLRKVAIFMNANPGVTAEGYGGTRRFAYNTSAEEQRENRRVNIIFDFPN